MEWKEVRLGDVCTKITDGSHFSPKAQTEGYPMLSVKDMREYDFDFSNCKKISYEDYLKMERDGCVPQIGDVLVAKDGSYLKEIFRCKEQREIALLSSIAIFRPNSQLIDSRFLCYCLKSPRVYNYISLNCVSGSALPRIILKDFKGVNIRVPSLDDQRRIASILSSLDRKIELNNKINADLEEMAQAIFKNWFVDFEPFKDGKFVDSELGMIPEGWKVGGLDEIADITMGQSPAGNSLNEKGEGMIFYQGSSDFGFRFPSIRVFTTEPKRLAVVNSVLFSVRAPVGDINVTKEECCIGRGVASIKSKYGHDSYLFYTMKSLHKLFDSFDGEGTVFGSINKKTLSTIQILLPSDGIVEQFNNIASSFDNRIRSLSDESSRLSLLRDTLLPCLMSGELEVPE